MRPACDFIVIGAMRSGSSSLNRYLADHPGIFMARPKEPHFFDENYERGMDWYRGLFSSASEGVLRGETTPAYLADHQAIERLATDLPNVKVIAVLRDPVDRAHSHYWMKANRGREARTFEQLVAQDLAKAGPGHLLWQSRYADHLEHLFQQIPRSRCLVIPFHDLVDRPTTTFRYVCRFLGADHTQIPDIVGKKVNVGFKVRSARLRRWSKHRLVSKRLMNAVALVNNVETRNPEIAEETRQLLDDWFQPHRAAALRAVADTLAQQTLAPSS